MNKNFNSKDQKLQLEKRTVLFHIKIKIYIFLKRKEMQHNNLSSAAWAQ